ncbi:MAG: HAMP domain-containing protein [Gammaproteobacteria bacterium]|uniref:histidine kinase n=1 Tax=Candidatus Thiopontia autotrophica TaxID=2841688 RepID=A0A8J6PA93_9GAMM|nr:HAMP domain-containing protein [Candidatus Thiopontia autotrophica]
MILVGLGIFFLQLITFIIFFKQMVMPNVETRVNHFVDALEKIRENPSLLRLAGEFDGTERENEFTGFILGSPDLKIRPAEWRIPFWHFVDDEIEERFGVPITMWESDHDPYGHDHGHYWVDLPVVWGKHKTGKSIRIGFSQERKGCLNPSVLLLVFLAVFFLSMVLVYYLTRWLLMPINKLRGAVGEMAMGSYPKPLPEKGPAEFSSLVQRFNWMVKSVQNLTENRSTMLVGISHDLKTPLARMRLSIEMLSREQSPELVEGIIDDLDVMDQMISEAMEFARGGKQGKLELTDLNRAITEVVDRKVRGGMRVGWRADSGQCKKEIDLSALHRILSNYLDNGYRYGDGESLEVRLDCSPEHTIIRVLNRGMGIPEKDLKNIFQPFYRVDESRSDKSGGSGLGLAIVKNLADVNGWKVALNNRTAGGIEASLQIT